MKNLMKTTMVAVLASTLFAATSVTLNNTSTDIIVELNSDIDIYGLQFDLKYDASKISVDAASVSGAEDVYAADKGNGLVRILMFDFDGQPLTAKSGNHLINLPFELNGALEASSLIEFTGEMIVAGYNGEKVQANFENNYLTLDSILPATTSLSKNYPNPFNPSTTIEYSIAKPGNVSLVIYDLNGSTVKTLVNDFVTANNYSVTWDGKNDNGQQVASGQYFYVMQAPGFSSTEYMTLIK